jgi:hypothetical protein
MTQSNNSTKKPTAEVLEERIHQTFHFLEEIAHSPDADDWLRYHMMVAMKIMHGENLKGTLLFNNKTGELKTIDEDHFHSH